MVGNSGSDLNYCGLDLGKILITTLDDCVWVVSFVSSRVYYFVYLACSLRVVGVVWVQLFYFLITCCFMKRRRKDGQTLFNDEILIRFLVN